jgi:hypothetical protein
LFAIDLKTDLGNRQIANRCAVLAGREEVHDDAVDGALESLLRNERMIEQHCQCEACTPTLESKRPALELWHVSGLSH